MSLVCSKHYRQTFTYIIPMYAVFNLPHKYSFPHLPSICAASRRQWLFSSVPLGTRLRSVCHSWHASLFYPDFSKTPRKLTFIQYFSVIFAIVLCIPCILKPLPRYSIGQCSVIHSRPSALQVATAFSVSVFQ